MKARTSFGWTVRSGVPGLMSRMFWALLLSIVALSAVAAAAGASDWLNEINRYREAAGLADLVEQPAWDAGLDHHLTYLEKTPSSYFTGSYQSAHTENPQSPYYTSDGASEAGFSDLDMGGAPSALAAVDDWFAAPFHAIGMLRAQLTQVALADHPSTGYAGLDVIQGLDQSRAPATGPILFPGPGIITNLVAFGGESPDPTETCGWQSKHVGLPIIALLTQAPSPSLSARLSGPGGLVSTSSGGLCLVDENTFHTSDGVYGPTGASILQGDNAVLLIPRAPLTTGTYAVDIQQPGQPDLTWSFNAAAPAPTSVPVTPPSKPGEPGTGTGSNRGSCATCLSRHRPVSLSVPRAIRSGSHVRIQVGGWRPFNVTLTVLTRTGGKVIFSYRGHLTAGRWNFTLHLPSWATRVRESVQILSRFRLDGKDIKLSAAVRFV